ncbi:hypothetical protein DENIS_2554 [Desulfonema ishimotonii]|uniref:Uncharacterized protein n=1 Tax=Desulfonema ishimotonii TaxID=45657 RepID=A0A401FX62_9BACT|nr:hypothetical protein DENIS_2554 [Desulfonema ishimotonii]
MEIGLNYSRMPHGVLSGPEPCAVKVARTVLRGPGDGNSPRLPGDAEGSGRYRSLHPLRR